MTPELSVGACYGYCHCGLTLFQPVVLLTSKVRKYPRIAVASGAIGPSFHLASLLVERYPTSHCASDDEDLIRCRPD